MRTEEWWLICAFGPQTILNLGLFGSAGSAISTGSGTYLYMLFGFERRACDTNQILRFSLLDYRWERVKCVGDKERGQKDESRSKWTAERNETGRSRESEP